MRKLLLFLLLIPTIARGQISGAGSFGCNGSSVQGAAWTSATALNTTQILASNVAGAQMLVTVDQTTTLTAGAITFLGDTGDSNFVALNTWQLVDPTTPPFASIGNPYTLQANTNKQFLIYMAGMTRLQLKLSTAITGSGSITPWTVIACNVLPVQVFQPTANNLATNEGAIGGVAVAVDANGRQIVKSYPDTTTTSYHASTLGLTVAASATDIAVLPGNATNKVILYKIKVSCTQTTAGIVAIQVIKRSTADTAGTSANMTVVPDYSSYAAGISVPKTYTVNPTTGTLVGNLDSNHFGCGQSTTTSDDLYLFNPPKPIILNGTAEMVVVNLNGVTVTGGSFDITFEYAETTTP